MARRRRPKVGVEADLLVPEFRAAAAEMAGVELVQRIALHLLSADRVKGAGRLGSARHGATEPVLVVHVKEARHEVHIVGIGQNERWHHRAALQLRGFGSRCEGRLDPRPEIRRLLRHGNEVPRPRRLRRLGRECRLGWRRHLCRPRVGHNVVLEEALLPHSGGRAQGRCEA